MRITAVADTDLFTGPTGTPRQVIRVTLAGPRETPISVRIEGPLVRTPEPVTVPAGAGADEDAETIVEVGVVFVPPAREGGVQRVTAIAEPADPLSGPRRSTLDALVTVAETGWTMWMVSHFHYDPVWWNTQAGFTDTWLDLPTAQEKRMPFQLSAFDLVRAHLDAAREDEDYRFVLAEVDYLKPHWDRFPRDRGVLRRFLREGRIELVGGTYNEPNTNLTHPESTIRNAVYGVGFQRSVMGGDPRTAWMVDVFGHDPAFPGLMADAGLDSSVWARGPWHHVGAKRHTGDIARMQFPSEFEWVAPSGRGLLTGYLADHYVAGWDIERRDTLEEAMAEAYKQFSTLRKVAATRNVLLPVGHDHNVPSRFCTQIHREWNARYLWPRFVVGLPRDFFAAVRTDAARRGTVFSVQTRDMNPVYTGKDVSYIDTKQAQRAAETAVLDGERVATLAALLGARYPREALDKAWRQLVYGAHHDAITGTESDQVYLDLLTGWREADALGRGVLAGAIDYLAEHVDTASAQETAAGVGSGSGSGSGNREGVAVIAVNTLSWPRDAVTTVTVHRHEPGTRGARVIDPAGRTVPSVAEGLARHPDGTLAEITLSFLARQVPALGYRVYRVLDDDEVPAGWTRVPGAPAIRNEAFLVEADPRRGGAVSRVRDLRAGRELLRSGGLAGELVLQAEHPRHPVWEEGPWHLLPAGPGETADAAPAVHVETSAIGRRLVAATVLRGLRITRHTVLWQGIGRVDMRTHVDGSIGQDHLLRARFDLDVPGALPVAEVGFAAVGRSFGFPEADAAEDLWTLDSPAHTWAGLSAPARIRLRAADGAEAQHAIGVAELIEPGGGARAGRAGRAAQASRVRALLAALVAKGVTATCSRPDGPRYGSLDVDSNLPDVRIVLGADNAFAREVLDSAGDAYRDALVDAGRVFVPALRTRREQWRPGADLRAPRDLPVLIVEDIGALIDDLADAVVDVAVPAGLGSTAEPLDGYSVAVVNQGTPGFVADPGGALYVSLMRSCSGWPAGVWIDGERRTVPDGSGFAWQHWSHTFDLSLVAGPGDWRDAGFSRAGQDVNHPIHARQVASGSGPLPRELSLMSVEPRTVLLTALKATGDPLARGGVEEAGAGASITVRVYETTGTATTATVTVHAGVESARRTDLLEEHGGESLPTGGGRAVVRLGAADVATVRMETGTGTGAGRSGSGAELAPAAEPVQPVFTRYWRHNAGPAPMGNLPVSVHVTPPRLRLDGGGTQTADVTVTVSCSGRPAAGHVELDVPPGLVVHQPDALTYQLAAGEYAEFIVPVRAEGSPGRYLVGARIRDDLGQILEDTVDLLVGAGDGADGGLVEVRIPEEALDLAPSGVAELPVTLVNRASSRIRGEVTVISPYGTWAGDLSVGPRVQPFALAAGEKGSVRVVVRAAATARAGAHWWALIRVSCHGELYYSPAVALRIAG